MGPPGRFLFTTSSACPTASSSRSECDSMVGLIPLFAVETLDPAVIEICPASNGACNGSSKIARLGDHIETRRPTKDHAVSFIVNRHPFKSVLRYMLDENEFLSPYGIRALSRYHREHPYRLRVNGMNTASTTSRRIEHWSLRRQLQLARTDLVSGELSTDRIATEIPLFLRRHYKIECPTSSGQISNLLASCRRNFPASHKYLSAG